MSSMLDSSGLKIGGSRTLIPRFAVLSASASGASELVAANGTNKIRVVSYNLISAGTVNAKFQSATTDKTGLKYLVANSGLVVGFSPLGHFETAAGEALNINLSAAIAVGGEFTYVLVPTT